MTEPTIVGAPLDIPEADLQEQRIAWQQLPEDALTDSAISTLAVTDRDAAEADVLEQAQPAVPEPDDDEHPYGSAP